MAMAMTADHAAQVLGSFIGLDVVDSLRDDEMDPRECRDIAASLVDDDGDTPADVEAALAALEIGLAGCECSGCECSGCECDRLATMTDDGGVPVCQRCADYIVVADGDVVCARMVDLGRECHACGESIEWGSIETGPPGASHYVVGECDCDERWVWEERSGWKNYAMWQQDAD